MLSFPSIDCTESDSCASSTERRVRQQNAYYKANKKAGTTTKKNKKKKVAIPVQTPRVPPFGAYVSPPEIPLHYQRMAAAAAAGEKSMCRALLFAFLVRVALQFSQMLKPLTFEIGFKYKYVTISINMQLSIYKTFYNTA